MSGFCSSDKGVEPKRRWRLDPAEFAYEKVLREYQRTGKHSVPKALLAELDRVRAQAQHPGTLRTFLDIALDLHDNSFDYDSYLAVDLLPLPGQTDDVLTARLRHDRIVTGLVRDAMLFETAATEGATGVLPERRPPGSLVLKRLRHGNDKLMTLPRGVVLDAAERSAVRLSMMPTGRAHDEYVFIRVLQVFEASFALIAIELTTAVDAVRQNRSAAVELVRVAERTLRESASLFAMLTTLRADSFQDLRRCTEGASIGRSRGYELVESLCRNAVSHPLLGSELNGFLVALTSWRAHYALVHRLLGDPLGVLLTAAERP